MHVKERLAQAEVDLWVRRAEHVCTVEAAMGGIQVAQPQVRRASGQEDAPAGRILEQGLPRENRKPRTRRHPRLLVPTRAHHRLALAHNLRCARLHRRGRHAVLCVHVRQPERVPPVRCCRRRAPRARLQQNASRRRVLLLCEPQQQFVRPPRIRADAVRFRQLGRRVSGGRRRRRRVSNLVARLCEPHAEPPRPARRARCRLPCLLEVPRGVLIPRESHLGVAELEQSAGQRGVAEAASVEGGRIGDRCAGDVASLVQRLTARERHRCRATEEASQDREQTSHDERGSAGAAGARTLTVAAQLGSRHVLC